MDDAEASDCVSLVAENDLSFLGVVAISDPIRPDVPAAVAEMPVGRYRSEDCDGRYTGYGQRNRTADRYVENG